MSHPIDIIKGLETYLKPSDNECLTAETYRQFFLHFFEHLLIRAKPQDGALWQAVLIATVNFQVQ
jgi:hypothetical protein